MQTDPLRAFLCCTTLVALMGLGGCTSDVALTPLADVCDAYPEGGRVMVEGILQGPGRMMSCDGETCEMAIRDFGTPMRMRMDVRLGRGKSSMREPPDNFSNDDLRVKDSEGTELQLGAPIRVRGRLLNSNGTCFLTHVNYVESIAMPSHSTAEGGGGAAPTPALAPPPAPPQAAPHAAQGDAKPSEEPAPTAGKP